MAAKKKVLAVKKAPKKKATKSTDALVPRSDFPLLAKQPKLVYLDSAATSQKPKYVLDAIRRFYETANANPHRGAYALSAAATQAYHDARVTVARFIGVKDVETVIFVRGTTEGLNLVASSYGRMNVKAGDNVVVTRMEHHANFVPWQQLCLASGAEFRIVELNADGGVDLEMMAKMVDARTKVVAFGHVSNALGTINPVSEIVALARRASPGALLVCDGAQAVPHLAVSVDALGVDVYAFSGHKMGAPMGSGAVVVRRSVLEKMPPYHFGGDMIEWVSDLDTTWNVLPHKFEAGTPNVEAAVGLAAACEYLSKIGMKKVRAHEIAVTKAMMAALRAVPGVTLYGTKTAEGRSGVVAFTLEGVHPHDVSTALDAAGICVRAGHHCAQPLMREMGVLATVRASVWLYTGARSAPILSEAVAGASRRFGAA
jgi:cysteine desulfurase/selenocysteine lyase